MTAVILVRYQNYSGDQYRDESLRMNARLKETEKIISNVSKYSLKLM